MSACQYFAQVIVKRADGPHMKYLCGCTGQPCLVEDPHDPTSCTPHVWYRAAQAKVHVPVSQVEESVLGALL